MDGLRVVPANARTAGRQRTGCLVTGCPCKDARIVSFRRAAFHAAMATQHGETADRHIAADPDWRLPVQAVRRANNRRTIEEQPKTPPDN